MRSVHHALQILSLCLLSLLLASPASAAEIATKYFTIALPDDWIQPQPIQELPNNAGILAIFQNKKDNSAVTLTVSATPMEAKDVATQTLANMKAAGLNVSDLVEKDGIYETSYSQGEMQGVTWVGSNGQEFAVTQLTGPSTETAKELLKNLKPLAEKLFPKF